MAKDYGADVKPHLRRIEREALKLLNTERARARAIYTDTRTMAAVLNKIETVKSVDATQAKTLGDLATSLKTLTSDARVEAAQELQGALQSLDRPGLLRKISTAQTVAQLANPKTIARNVVGNELFYRLERVNRYPATAIDFARSKLTGTERQITFRTAGQGDYWKNFLRGARAGAKGVNPLGIQSQYDFSGPAYKSKLNPLFYLERGLKASIQSFDFAAYMRARNQTLAELGVLKAQREGVPTAERRNYVKKFVDSADAASIEIAHNYGKFVTFQDDNLISTALGGLKKELNFGQDFGLGDVVLKYPRTPGALIMRGIDYSPAGILRGIYLLKPFMGKNKTPDTRESVLAVSRAITGTLGTTALGYFLRDAGVLTGEDEKDRDVAAFKREQTGEGKFKVNVSAVQRWMLGGFRPADLTKRQGDMLASYDWAQPIAMSLSIGAKINESLNRKKDAPEGIMPVAYDAAKSGLNTIAEQPVIKGVRELFDGSNQKEGIVGGLENAAEGVPASFIPTFLNQIRQYTDNQSRVTYDANPARRALNRAMAKLPIVASTLPAAYTTLGKPKETYRDQKNSLFNVFLNPAFVEKYTVDPQIEMVLRPYAAEERKEQFPRVAPKKIKHDGKDYELSGGELSRLQKELGEQTAARFGKLDPAGLAGMTPEEQEKKLAEEVSGAWEQAKNNLLQKRGVDLYAGYRREMASKGLKSEQIDHNVRVRGEVAELHKRVKADSSISDEKKKKLVGYISTQLGSGRVKIKDEDRTLDEIKQDFQDAMEVIEEELKDKIEEAKEEEDDES